MSPVALASNGLAVDLDGPHRRLHEPDDALFGDVVAPGLERVKRRKHQVGRAVVSLGRVARLTTRRDLAERFGEARSGRQGEDRD